VGFSRRYQVEELVAASASISRNEYESWTSSYPSLILCHDPTPSGTNSSQSSMSYFQDAIVTYEGTAFEQMSDKLQFVADLCHSHVTTN
jgi:hypothetical protein